MSAVRPPPGARTCELLCAGWGLPQPDVVAVGIADLGDKQPGAHVGRLLHHLRAGGLEGAEGHAEMSSTSKNGTGPLACPGRAHWGRGRSRLR